jgi:dGTPase
VYDVIDATRAAVLAAGVQHRDEVATAGVLVCFSADMRAQSTELKRFLFQNLYRHAQVEQSMDDARQVVRELFAAYVAEPPAALSQREGDTAERAVADYIAGMTDRYAISAHQQMGGQLRFEPAAVTGG